MKKMVILLTMAVVLLTGCGSNVKEVSINVDDVKVSDVIKLTNEIENNYLCEYEVTLTSYSVPVMTTKHIKSKRDFIELMKPYVTK